MSVLVSIQVAQRYSGRLNLLNLRRELSLDLADSPVREQSGQQPRQPIWVSLGQAWRSPGPKSASDGIRHPNPDSQVSNEPRRERPRPFAISEVDRRMPCWKASTIPALTPSVKPKSSASVHDQTSILHGDGAEREKISMRQQLYSDHPASVNDTANEWRPMNCRPFSSIVDRREADR